MTSLAELGDQLTTLYLFKMFSSKLNVLAYALTAWLKAWQTFHIVFSVQNSNSDSKYLHTQTHVLFSRLHQPISLTCKCWRCSSVQLYTPPSPHPPLPLYPPSPPPPAPQAKTMKSSLSTETTSSLEEYKHTANTMIHQLENRDGQSAGYCQATCGFASSARETQSPVEAPQITA